MRATMSYELNSFIPQTASDCGLFIQPCISRI